MFAACEPLKAKVEVMEEFASVAWSISSQGGDLLKWACVWLELPQAQVSLSHLSWPNPICNRNLISRLNIYIYIYVIWCGKKSAIVMIPNKLANAAVWES